MSREGRVVCVDFVDQHFCLVVARQQHLELKCSRLVGETPGSVRHQQGHNPVQAAGRDFEVSDDGELRHVRASVGIRDPPGRRENSLATPPRAPAAARRGAAGSPSREKSIASIRSPRRAIRALAAPMPARSSCAWRKCVSSFPARSTSIRTSLTQLADLGLDRLRLVAHARVAQDRLGDVDRHHHQRRRDDDDAGAMGLLHHVVEMLDEIGIDRLRRHEHQRDVLRLAGQKIALGDVLDVLADVGAHARLRRFARLVVARRAQRREALERKLGVDREQPLVARQADDAVGPRAVRERRPGSRRRPPAGRRARSPPSAPWPKAPRACLLARMSFSDTTSRVISVSRACAASITARRSLSLPRFSPVVCACDFEPGAEPRADRIEPVGRRRGRGRSGGSRATRPCPPPGRRARRSTARARRSAPRSPPAARAPHPPRAVAPPRRASARSGSRRAAAPARPAPRRAPAGRKIGTPSMTAIGETGVAWAIRRSKSNKSRTHLTAPVQTINWTGPVPPSVPWPSVRSSSCPTRSCASSASRIERVDAPLRKLIDDMIETMHDAPGVGLAAIQIAEPIRLLVVDVATQGGAAEPAGVRQSGDRVVVGRALDL